MTKDWTNRKDEDADIVLAVVEKLINKYGMQIVLEALIHQSGIAVAGAQAFGVAGGFLLTLEKNLKTALKEYEGRHDEFGK